jgi:hypothetical protein
MLVIRYFISPKIVSSCGMYIPTTCPLFVITLLVLWTLLLHQYSALTLLSGLKVQPKTLINPLLEGYLSYKINDYTTITSTANYQTDLHQSQYKLKANINKRIGKSHVLFLGAETTKPRNYDKLNFFTGLEYYF